VGMPTLRVPYTPKRGSLQYRHDDDMLLTDTNNIACLPKGLLRTRMDAVKAGARAP